MGRPAHSGVAIWTLSPLVDYTYEELELAARIHSQLGLGTLVLAPPHRP